MGSSLHFWETCCGLTESKTLSRVLRGFMASVCDLGSDCLQTVCCVCFLQFSGSVKSTNTCSHGCSQFWNILLPSEGAPHTLCQPLPPHRAPPGPLPVSVISRSGHTQKRNCRAVASVPGFFSQHRVLWVGGVAAWVRASPFSWLSHAPSAHLSDDGHLPEGVILKDNICPTAGVTQGCFGGRIGH